jgi:SPP1 gp7 family putative phage head morphogenesis protein
MANIFSRLFGTPDLPPKSVEDKFDPKNVVVLRKTFPINPQTVTARTGGNQVSQTYDLATIDRFVDNESIAFQTFAKIAEKGTNSGWTIACKDPEIVIYLKQRFTEIAIVAGKPNDILVREVLDDLIKYSNCFLYKVRDEENSSGNPIKNEASLPPISTYQRLDPTTVAPERDDKGNVKRYVVAPTVQGGTGGGGNTKPKNVRVEDMVHIYCFKYERNNVGEPYIWPVLDDIRVLRKIEENVELLIHQHLFPLYQYIIGNKDHEIEPEEIEKIASDIENMPTEGGFVTPWHHKIEVLGAQGEAIGAEKYIEHFQNRVLMGLGIGEVSYGLSGGASRASSETMYNSLTEKAKFYQKVLSVFWDEMIIKELLQEGGYETYDQANAIEAHLIFAEIDIDSKIKKENQLIQLFLNNAITYDEYRLGLGYEVLDTESDDAQKLFFNLFGPAKLVEYDLELAELSASAKVKPAEGSGATSNASRPSNQHGTKSAPGRKRDILTDAKTDIARLKRSESVKRLLTNVNTQYDNARRDVMNVLARAEQEGLGVQESHVNNAKLTIGIMQDFVMSTSSPHIDQAFVDGFSQGFPGQISAARRAIEDARSKDVLTQYGKFVRKTMTNLQNDVMNILGLSTSSMTEKVKSLSSLFDVRKYYLDSAVVTGVSKAFNYGHAYALKQTGSPTAIIRVNSGACDACKALDGTRIDVEHAEPEDVPPHHINCECTLEPLVEEENGQVS